MTYVWLKTQHDKQLPSLRQLLARTVSGERRAPQPTTRSQQLAAYQLVAARFKLPLRVKTEATT